MRELLNIENLSSGYNGETVLHNITLALCKGEVLAVIGQNGCGKSTLLKTIARIIQDNTGNIIFDSLNLQNMNTWDLKKVGLSLFVQGGMVFPTMRVNDHFNLILKNKNKKEVIFIKDECFSFFPTLKDNLSKRAGNLSGGQRQMLSLAMLFVQQTTCWLLDEPTAGLSPDAVKETTEFLKRMKQEENKTMILVEHNYPVAFALADHVAIIKEGKLYDSYPKTEFQKDDFLSTHLYN